METFRAVCTVMFFVVAALWVAAMVLAVVNEALDNRMGAYFEAIMPKKYKIYVRRSDGLYVVKRKTLLFYSTIKLSAGARRYCINNGIITADDGGDRNTVLFSSQEVAIAFIGTLREYINEMNKPRNTEVASFGNSDAKSLASISKAHK